jgi:hypothetical protein
MSPIDERLKSLNIVLPDVMPPVVDGYVPAFAPFTRSGDQIHLSGRLGKKGGKLLCGKVGEEISWDQGKLAARGLCDPEDQRRFVGQVRRALADDIERDEPLQPVRLREGSAPAPALPAHEVDREVTR